MSRTRIKHRSKWRQVAILLTISVISIFLIVTALFAEPDSTKPAITSKLQEGVFVQTDTTHRPPNPVSLKALERLQANSTEKWNVQWEPKTGLPGLGGGVLQTQYEGEPEGKALAFAEDYKGLFLGIADSQVLADYGFVVSRKFPEKRFTAVHLEEVYKGVKVYQGVLGVWISDEPILNQVTNQLKSITLDDVTPTLSVGQVEEIIRETVAPLPVGEHDGKMELVIYPSSPPRLAWFAERKIDRIPWVFLIEAHTGEIIWAKSGLVREPRRIPTTTEDTAEAPDTGSKPPLHQAQPMRWLPDVEKRGLDTLITPQKPDQQSDEKMPGAIRLPKTPGRAPQYVDAWFYDVNFLPGGDGDDDGYMNSGMIEWDVNIPEYFHISNDIVIDSGIASC